MTRAEVEAALGKPSAALTMGNRLVLLYPNGGRIEFEQGVVITAVKVPVDTSASPAPASPAPTTPPAPAPASPPAAVAPPPAAPPAAQATLPAPQPAAQAPAPKTEDAQAKAEAEMERARQENQRRMEAITERLEEQHGKMNIEVGPSPRIFWTSAVIGWVCRIVITIVVLKMAFKWSDVHADWIQMVIPAVADTVTQSLVQGVAFALWKTDQLFHIDAAISYFVLLGVLMKTTHACTLARAVAVAGAAKLASLVMWALISVLILHLVT